MITIVFVAVLMFVVGAAAGGVVEGWWLRPQIAKYRRRWREAVATLEAVSQLTPEDQGKLRELVAGQLAADRRRLPQPENTYRPWWL